MLLLNTMAEALQLFPHKILAKVRYVLQSTKFHHMQKELNLNFDILH